jgi:aconitate hydratase 2/2-methylisocitrate dehydratase
MPDFFISSEEKMSADLKAFAEGYQKQIKDRKAQGIPPLPLSDKETAAVCSGLSIDNLEENLFLDFGKDTAKALVHLIQNRVPPGVYPASKVKADFLGVIAKGEKPNKYITQDSALEMLGQMIGGYAVTYLLDVLEQNNKLAPQTKDVLSRLFLINKEELDRVIKMAQANNGSAKELIKDWAEASWFSKMAKLPEKVKGIAVRTRGEINTDFFSPAQEASTRDDIPLHALKILSTSPDDKNFLERVAKLKEKNLPLLFIGDVVGTGSSRKSAANSLVWCIGEEIPHVPNKNKGGYVIASKIAPIFYNTVRGCGAVPVRCSTSKIEEGMALTVDFQNGKITDESGATLSEFKLEPTSIKDEYQAGGRNNLIIGRKLTIRAREASSNLGIKIGASQLNIELAVSERKGQAYTLAQKLVGRASGLSGVLPGEYVEPKAHLVFSQDTTGGMTQQEIQELACAKFASPFIQSFCHTAAGPKSKDATNQTKLGKFVSELVGIDLRPGDGVIHTVGNRFLLPYFVGTGGDSHTRFPIGISFPAGSDLVAFAASQGYFPLDMPESVLVRFKGKPEFGITVRDLVNAIPYMAIKTGKLNNEKGDAKVNIFADRIQEIEGLEFLNVMESFKFTDTSAERSSAAAMFNHSKESIMAYVENNLRFLKNNFAKRHTSPVVGDLIHQFAAWLKNPVIEEKDADAKFAEIMEIDLKDIKEPILAAPNDPDKAVLLSQAAGTRIDEVFIGSCMTDISDFRAAAAILDGEQVKHDMKVWTVPPDRESQSQLATEGTMQKILDAGANIHVPGCSLCMGNQAQVSANSTVFSTSTRNFNNRMGTGAQVYLGSAHVGAMITILGHIPSTAEYMDLYKKKVQGKEKEISKQLVFK